MVYLVNALYIICLVTLIGMAWFVYRRDPERALNRMFAFGAASLFVWLTTLFAFDRTSDSPWLTPLGRVNLASTLFVAAAAFLFFATFVGRPMRTLHVLVPVSLLALVTIFSPWIDHEETVEQGQHITHNGPAFAVYVLTILALLAIPIGQAVAARRTASRRLRAQLAVIGAGTATSAIIGVVTGFVLPYGYHNFAYEELGALSILFFLTSVWYAISVQHLFDLRIFLRRTVVFTLLLGFVLAGYAGVLLLLAEAVPTDGSTGAWHNAVMVLAILLIAFSFDPLRRWIELRTDSVLFRRELAQQRALALLARRLAGVTSLEQALPATLTTVQETFRPHRAAAMAFERGEQGEHTLKRLDQVGFASHAQLLCTELPAIAAYAEEHRRVFPVPMATQGGVTAPEAMAKLAALGVGLVAPLVNSGELCGLLLLGHKRSDSPFSEDDQAVLEGMASEVVSAIQKARFFESDQTKSEFVSIAAHELVTPIAAVQGYLSMILDEHMGVIDDEARRYLSKAYPA